MLKNQNKTSLQVDSNMLMQNQQFLNSLNLGNRLSPAKAKALGLVNKMNQIFPEAPAAPSNPFYIQNEALIQTNNIPVSVG